MTSELLLETKVEALTSYLLAETGVQWRQFSEYERDLFCGAADFIVTAFEDRPSPVRIIRSPWSHHIDGGPRWAVGKGSLDLFNAIAESLPELLSQPGVLDLICGRESPELAFDFQTPRAVEETQPKPLSWSFRIPILDAKISVSW